MIKLMLVRLKLCLSRTSSVKLLIDKLFRKVKPRCVSHLSNRYMLER